MAGFAWGQIQNTIYEVEAIGAVALDIGRIYEARSAEETAARAAQLADIAAKEQILREYFGNFVTGIAKGETGAALQTESENLKQRMASSRAGFRPLGAKSPRPTA